jgi:hypothetical protein
MMNQDACLLPNGQDECWSPGRIGARENVADADLLDCLWPTFGHYSLGLDLRKSLYTGTDSVDKLN